MSVLKRVTITNFKKIEFADITPDGNLVKISGKNGQGKSSVLDAIAAALAGANKIDTPKPIRHGEDSAEIVLETEDLIVTRKFLKSGPKLEVTTVDGAKFPKAQAKLNDLIGNLSFDPMAFTRMSDKEQREELLSIVDLPFKLDEMDAERKALFDHRADIGRQSKAIGTVEWRDSLPAVEESASDLIQQIRQAQQRNDQVTQFRNKVGQLGEKHGLIRSQIEKLMEELKQVESQIHEGQQWLKTNGTTQDTAELEQRLATIEERNTEIRANLIEREKLTKQTDLDNEYDALTNKIAELDKSKADGLAAAKMPVDGLGFDAQGVTYNDIPLKQVNPGDVIIISTKIGMALNPKLKVMRIMEGSLLDSESMRDLEALAEKHGHQIWVEIVSDGSGPGIVLEEGRVKA